MQQKSTKGTIQTTLDSVMPPRYKQRTYPTLTSWLEDSRVKHFLMQEKDVDSMTPEERSFLKSQGFSETKNHDIFYSKTFEAYYLTMGEVLSRKCFKFSPSWGMMFNGRYIIAKTMELPRTGSDCILRDFLERERCPRQILPIGGASTTVDARQRKTTEHTLIRVDDNPENNKYQAKRVYSTDGLSSTLCANAGGDGGKIGLYLIPEEQSQIQTVGNINPSGKGLHGEVYHPNGVTPCICASDYKDAKKILIRDNTRKGYLECQCGDGITLGHYTGRGKVQRQSTGTLDTSCSIGTLTDTYRIRRLTPLECEKLQGFPQRWTEYGSDGEPISDTQRYKCLGNAVTVNVVRDIMDDWNITEEEEE